MAVTESSGNGFALYNGVKLPSLPEWDKETYPYAFVYKIPNGNAFLIVGTTPWMKDSYGTISPSVSGLACRYKCSSGESEWTVDYSNKEVNGDDNYVDTDACWSNYDILNTDGTTYLAASDPIPLDGMNVIEWDGDTTGLDVTLMHYYRVADYFDIENGVAVFNTASGVQVYSGVQRNATNEQMWMVSGYVTGYPTGYSSNISSGCYFVKTPAISTSLFAYYPIETGGEEISKGKAFLLHRIFSAPIAYAMTGKRFWLE